MLRFFFIQMFRSKVGSCDDNTRALARGSGGSIFLLLGHCFSLFIRNEASIPLSSLIKQLAHQWLFNQKKHRPVKHSLPPCPSVWIVVISEKRCQEQKLPRLGVALALLKDSSGSPPTIVSSTSTHSSAAQWGLNLSWVIANSEGELYY